MIWENTGRFLVKKKANHCFPATEQNIWKPLSKFSNYNYPPQQTPPTHNACPLTSLPLSLIHTNKPAQHKITVLSPRLLDKQSQMNTDEGIEICPDFK